MPPDWLPEAFALPTTIDIDQTKWAVAKAEPFKAADFIQTGKLVLTVKKVLAKSSLYALPSVCDRIPGLLAGSHQIGKSVFDIFEDDWRQVEFVSAAYRDAILADISAIQHFFDEESVLTGSGISLSGFRQLYIRKAIQVPIQSRLTLDELYASCPGIRLHYDGIVYACGTDQLLENCFAVQLESVTVYGETRNGLVQIIGIIAQEKDAIAAFAKGCRELMTRQALWLVDWCGRDCIMP